jgi:geranylgeranylglycerol-phosphate geranylgeranyltransferase
MVLLNSSSKLFPYWSIIRPLNCIIGGLSLVIATVVVLSVDILIENAYLVFIGSIIMYLVSAGGFIINDIFDIEIDKINTPHRVLPSGQMSLRTAYIYTGVIFTISFFLSLYSMTIPTNLNLGLIPPFATLFGIVSLVLYAGWLKKLGIIGNLLIALLAVVPFVIGGIVINDLSRGILPMIIVLSLIYSREIIKDILDVKGDIEASGSFYSLPALIGVKNTVWLARISLSILVLSCFSPLFIEAFRFYKSWSLLGLGFVYLVFTVRIIYLLRGDTDTIIKNAREGKTLLKLGIIIGLFGLGGNSLTPIL